MNAQDVKLANKYQQKTDKQHILDNPDTYIGSVEKIDSQQWILNDDNTKIFERNIEYVPGLFKLFDEGIVNARDHSVRMTQAIANGQYNALPVTNIEITIEEDGTIIMLNDGNGIDNHRDGSAAGLVTGRPNCPGAQRPYRQYSK